MRSTLAVAPRALACCLSVGGASGALVPSRSATVLGADLGGRGGWFVRLPLVAGTPPAARRGPRFVLAIGAQAIRMSMINNQMDSFCHTAASKAVPTQRRANDGARPRAQGEVCVPATHVLVMEGGGGGGGPPPVAHPRATDARGTPLGRRRRPCQGMRCARSRRAHARGGAGGALAAAAAVGVTPAVQTAAVVTDTARTRADGALTETASTGTVWASGGLRSASGGGGGGGGGGVNVSPASPCR